jgi:hypothetical protein
MTLNLNQSPRFAQRLAAAVLAALLPTSAATSQAAAWRCELDGAVVYTDRPCPAGVDSGRKVDAVINVVPAVDTSAGPRGVKSNGTAKRNSAKPTKLRRDPQVVAAFRKLKPCPATGKHKGACPGYEIDHIVPLAAGGADAPSNMQWLTRQQHRAKTRREREACVYGCRP